VPALLLPSPDSAFEDFWLSNYCEANQEPVADPSSSSRPLENKYCAVVENNRIEPDF
jgi:hypothetical protein